MTTKAIINFSSYAAVELGTLAQVIHDKMTLNAATFATPPVTMAAFQTQITDYAAKLQARASNASADILALNTARDDLEEVLKTLGNYVNSIAKGDPVVVEQSGIPSYDTAHAPDTSAPAAPTNLRLSHGDVGGSVVARYKPEHSPSTNEVQTNTGDPNNEADWHQRGLFKSGKAEMDGFTPGSILWVRVRTVGLKGVMGAWSDPAQIRVL